MNISSRTPEGDPDRCPVCGSDLRLEPSRPPGDAPCPSCGSLVWFRTPGAASASALEAAPSGTVPKGELIPTSGDAIVLARPHLRVGRRESCDVRLPYPNVSGLHCELVVVDGRWIIRDLNSTNGVKVNGVRVAEATLYPGDRITLGKRDYTIRYSPSST